MVLVSTIVVNLKYYTNKHKLLKLPNRQGWYLTNLYPWQVAPQQSLFPFIPAAQM